MQNYKDEYKVNDVLLSLKALLNEYTTCIMECSHQPLANTWMHLQTETYQAQREIFQLMHVRGWYPLTPECPDKIKQTIQDHQNKAIELK